MTVATCSCCVLSLQTITTVTSAGVAETCITVSSTQAEEADTRVAKIVVCRWLACNSTTLPCTASHALIVVFSHTVRVVLLLDGVSRLSPEGSLQSVLLLLI